MVHERFSTKSVMSVNVLTGVLLILLAGQFLARGGPLTSPPLGPSPGTPVPGLTVDVLDGPGGLTLARLLADDENCTLLVIISPTCPTCSRMRVTWPARFRSWADSVGAPVRPLWLSVGGSSALRAFASSFRLPASGITLASVPEEATNDVFNAFGVLGTPTLYLVDSSGIMRAGLIGDAFPPLDLATAVCRLST